MAKRHRYKTVGQVERARQSRRDQYRRNNLVAYLLAANPDVPKCEIAKAIGIKPGTFYSMARSGFCKFLVEGVKSSPQERITPYEIVEGKLRLFTQPLRIPPHEEDLPEI